MVSGGDKLFHALTFVYDDIPSETYGLYILNIDDSGKVSSESGSTADLITQSVFNNPINYLLGIKKNTPLTFDLTIGSLEPIDRKIISFIQSWLYSKNNYRKLQIVQNDMLDIYYNCILVPEKIVTIANYPYAFNCKVICDSPYAWTFPKQFTYTDFTKKIIHNNFSENDFYDFPIIEFITSSTASEIVNHSENRITSFSGLQIGEKIILDNMKKTIISSTGLNRLKNFNLNFFRLLPHHINEITANGIRELKITYSYARKVGS